MKHRLTGCNGVSKLWLYTYERNEVWKSYYQYIQSITQLYSANSQNVNKMKWNNPAYLVSIEGEEKW